MGTCLMLWLFILLLFSLPSLQAEKSYMVPSPVQEGPVLDPGQDLSKDRKNDYETETTEG